MHGFVETMEVESVRVITEAYLKRGDHSEYIHLYIYRNSSNLFLDIIVLDWGELADGNYLLDAVPNAAKVILMKILIVHRLNSFTFSLETSSPIRFSI